MKILTTKQYNDLLEKANQKDTKTLESRIVELEKQNLNLIEDQKVPLKRKELQLQNTVDEKTRELQNKITELTIKNNNSEKEVEILTKAFENLGFDVKDMKEILSKLVDGIVSKNSIQLVK